MELWSEQHAKTLIPAIAMMLIFGVVACRFLARREEKIRMIPLQIIAVLLVLLELGKQGLSLYRGYDLYHLPFHYCSIYIFAVPVIAFYRGKNEQLVQELGFALVTALFLIMLIYPSLIYPAWDVDSFFESYFSFHTVVFHNLVMLAWVLMVALNIPNPETKAATKPLTVLLAGFCAVSATMAQILKTNFANFYSCNIPPLEAVRLMIQNAAGYGAAQFVYVLAVAAVTIGFTLLFYALGRLVRKLVARVFSKKVSKVGV